VAGGEMAMAALVQVNCPVPEQNEQLPDRIELMSAEAGRNFSQELFRLAIEKADLELVLSNRGGKDGAGIERLGKRRYTFKTQFGTVRVKRIRIRHKADGSTETPSARVWGTPRQLFVTRGLKKAVCNLVVKQSFSSTLRQIER